MFEIGEKVSFLYEKGEGIIKSFQSNRVLVEDETGFDRWFDFGEIVKIHGKKYESTISFEASIEQKEELSYRVVEQRSIQNKGFIEWETDLHIDSILESTRGLTNFEMLQNQMKEFKATFNKAKKNNVNRLIVIHGVGEGVLKNEVRSYLANQSGIEFYDADFREYGKGATTIDFHPNW